MREYREIPGYPGYDIADDGTVWSRRIKGTRGKIGENRIPLSVYRRPKWPHYRVVCFRPESGGRVVQRYVHELVLESFVGPRPIGMECRHKDGNAGNNRSDNLCWGTHQDNIDDIDKHGRRMHGEKNPNCRLTSAEIDTIKKLRSDGLTHQTIAGRFGLSKGYIGEILRGKKRAVS